MTLVVFVFAHRDLVQTVSKPVPLVVFVFAHRDLLQTVSYPVPLVVFVFAVSKPPCP